MAFALSKMQLTCPNFADGTGIPKQFTGEGDDVSPALDWTDAPEGTRAFAVFCHDPDAPLIASNGTYGFVHWVLYNIPASVSRLPEGCSDYTAGQNNFGNTGYGGPMPPDAHGVHNYYFWVLALDKDLQLQAGLTLWELLAEIEPHVIGMNRLVGTYERE